MSQQTHLDAFTRSRMERVYTPPATTPEDAGERIDGQAGNVCRNCGALVSARYARVAGDNQNRVWACTACADGGQLRDGAAAKPDYDLDAAPAANSLDAHGYPASGGEF